jgi:hypothetical protein
MQSDTFLDIVGDIHVFDAPISTGLQDFRIDELINRAEFDQDYEQWLQDSEFDSLPEHMKAHASYLSIVAMGQRAIPVIAAELRKRPSFLFLALEDITGDDPVPEEFQGNLRATIDAWLTWLRK